MAPEISVTKKRLALAIHDFLSTSLKDGTIAADDAESVEIAQQCIADVFHVDPMDPKAMQEALGGQNLQSIYGVYEKLKGRGAAATEGASSAGAAPAADASTGSSSTEAPATPNPEAESFKSAGNAAMQRKDYPAAIEAYSKALNLVPLNPIYLSNRAAAYSASGQHAAASTDAEMAVASAPSYTKGWSRLGLARFALGDAKGSMEAYAKGIEYEGSGGSPAMKKGYETAKRKVEEEEAGATGPDVSEEQEPTSPGTARGAPSQGAGGMPDLSSLAGMFGGAGGGRGGGMPDLSSIMSNPMFASMAQNLMNNPDMMNNIMSNPRLRQMAEQFGGAGGAGGGQGGEGGEGGGEAGRGGGMPDISSLMNDPSIAEMARNLMGGGRGGGAGGAGAGRGAGS